MAELTNPRHEGFSWLVATLTEEPVSAMRVVGYAETTIHSKGPNWLLAREDIQQRITEIRKQVFGDIVGRLQEPMDRLPNLLTKAFNVIEDILDGKPAEITVQVKRDGKWTEEKRKTYASMATRGRIATQVAHFTNGLLEAVLPKEVRTKSLTIHAVLEKHKLAPPIDVDGD